MSEASNKSHKDYVTSILTFIVSLFYFIMTMAIKKAPIGNPWAPRYFPIIIAGIGFTMALVLFVRGYHTSKRETVSENEANDEEERRDSKLIIKIVVYTSILGFGFSFLFEILGFIVSMILFLTLFMFFINGRKSWKSNIVTPIVFSIVTYLLFSLLLSVPLPLLPDFMR